MSKVVRSVKNVTKGYSSVQVKVRNGKSNLTSAAISAWIIKIVCLVVIYITVKPVYLRFTLVLTAGPQQQVMILGVLRARK
jgi:hypothetical protein